mmetsp:Transcript_17547/g.42851  ORF Transcript_17547/g.42851 Transcript_17547/m.42851 type:complete len:205 (+) Transcript_17547:8892-9506(+)
MIPHRKLKHDHSSTPNVRGPGIWLPLEPFRRHVASGPGERLSHVLALGRQGQHWLPCGCIHVLTGPEVRNLDDPLVGDQAVRWLHVSVNDLVVVQVCQAKEYLPDDDGQRRFRGRPVLRDAIVDCPLVTELEHNVRLVIPVVSVIYLDKVGALVLSQLGLQELHLRYQLFPQLLVMNVEQHLDGQVLARCVVLGLVDDAAGAPP